MTWGRGKTVQVVAALRILKAREEIESCIVVAPASVLDQRRRKIARFAEPLQEAWRLVDEGRFLDWQAAFPGFWVLHGALCSTHMPSYLPCLSPRGRAL